MLPETLLVEAGESCEVDFAQPITGQLLDIGADFDKRLEVDFSSAGNDSGSLSVPAVPWTGACTAKPESNRAAAVAAALRAESAWDRSWSAGQEQGTATNAVWGMSSSSPTVRGIR